MNFDLYGEPWRVSWVEENGVLSTYMFLNVNSGKYKPITIINLHGFGYDEALRLLIQEVGVALNTEFKKQFRRVAL